MSEVSVSLPFLPPDEDLAGGGAEGVDGLRGLLERAVHAVLEDAEVVGAEISVTLLDDPGIRDLNARYLDRNRPTDVIAFSLPGPEGQVVGDVYIGVEQAVRQAPEGGSLTEELVRLAVHGTLHVLGHDHPEGDERYTSPMFQSQERLVRNVLS